MMRGRYLRPSFFIIGERKCGTSSLYRYLISHPGVLPCKVKEPQFFSKPAWYRICFYKRYLALFPKRYASGKVELEWYILENDGSLKKTTLAFTQKADLTYITGEASANTFAQVEPKILYRAFPDARLILLLRNPADRAFSHYAMLYRFQQEGRRLPIRLSTFKEDVPLDIARWRKGKKTFFIGPGIYIRPLKRWLKQFPRRQLYLLRTEDLRDSDKAQQHLGYLCQFLGLEDHDFSGIMDQAFNVSPAGGMDSETRTLLESFYNKSVLELEALTGERFNWY